MKRFFIVILMVCVTVIFFDSCGKVALNVRYWKAANDNFQFPELTDPELKYTPILKRPSFGICVSGGGTVSASLIMGYFKALEEMKLMDKARYISGVSGGAWGSAPYCFLPPDIPDDQFLGPKYLPGKLTRAILEENHPRSMTNAVTHARIVDLSLENIFYTHEAFTRAVGEIFLKPFGIPYARKYFSTGPDTVSKIILRNPGLNHDDFVTLREDRPYLIMNATIFLPVPNPGLCSKYSIFPFEFTPLYSGLNSKELMRGIDNQVIGGAYVESFGFDTLNPIKAGKETVTVTPGKRRFALCEPVGTSGAALEEEAVKWAPITTLPFPQFKYWNPSDSQLAQTKTYNFGDGGILEDTGVVALLRRKVKNIVVFLTTPFDTKNPIDPYDANEMKERFYGYNQVACLFGHKIYDTSCGPNYGKKIPDAYNRQVFCSEEFEELEKGFQGTKKAGGPPFYRGTFHVVDNGMFGVKGGWTCNIIWMCVDTGTNFNKKLPGSIRDEIGKYGGPLQDFPVVKVFMQNKGSIIQLKPIQANLLGNFAYWMVKSRCKDFHDFLNQEPVRE